MEPHLKSGLLLFVLPSSHHGPLHAVEMILKGLEKWLQLPQCRSGAMRVVFQ